MMKLLTTIYLFLKPIISWIAPKLADKYFDKWFDKKAIYIDRCLIATTEDGVSLDITLSTTIDTAVSINHFIAIFYDKHPIPGIHGIQQVSAHYKVLDKDGKLIMTLNNTVVNSTNRAFDSGSSITLESDLIQTIDTKTIDRFIIQWYCPSDFTKYDTVDITLTYAHKGKSKNTKVFSIPNPCYIHKERPKGTTLRILR